MIRNKASKLILLGYILFMVALNVCPMILRALEYKTSEPVPKNSEQQPLEEPATMTHMVDSNGETHWFANLYSSAHGTDSVTTVQNIYVVGVMADWLDIMNSLQTFTDIFDIAMMPLLVVLLVRLLGNLTKAPTPNWIDC
jgi:predicted cobalt transporter CbtA